MCHWQYAVLVSTRDTFVECKVAQLLNEDSFVGLARLPQQHHHCHYLQYAGAKPKPHIDIQ